MLYYFYSGLIWLLNLNGYLYYNVNTPDFLFTEHSLELTTFNYELLFGK
jgi:hypothetical protein